MSERRGIERIVVGVDGSEPAAAALRMAIRMARGMGSEVIAVYGVDLPPYYASAPYAPPVQFDPQWRDAMRKAFEEDWCQPLVESGVRHRLVMDDGRPASVIGRVADQEHADIVLVGRRGRGGFKELLLGSVSHELTLHSHLPILIVSH